MSENNKIKVVGYSQRVFYNDGIEYRDFTPDLVGNQQTQGDGNESSNLTFSNFVTSPNSSPREILSYNTGSFSDFYSLETLNTNEELITKITSKSVTLNLDKEDLNNYALFGSTMEFLRVTLEEIIVNWPASIYVDSIVGENNDNNISNYVYNSINNTSKFNIKTDYIINKFNINYQNNGTLANTFNEENKIRNFTTNFIDYVIDYNNNEYVIINVTGSTNILDDNIIVEVIGSPFTIGANEQSLRFHIRPKKEIIDNFFNSLSDFGSQLLNRFTNPQYTIKIKRDKEGPEGNIIKGFETLTWPVSDGYNIDYDTIEYNNYVEELLEITKDRDNNFSDLVVRFLVSESISDFDTLPKCDTNVVEEGAGQKMNKTLRIYGRSFDETIKYIKGISFANVVTYDKVNNTPDQTVKNLARILGWELTSSLLENNLVKNYITTNEKNYPGYSRGLTQNEADIELWRRLILNSAWLWKSKGTRKAIEFIFKLIGTPDGLINFNEYLYVADGPIDMDLFYTILDNNDLSDDINLYNVDADGYPKFFSNTEDMYFQSKGQWYRQTGGSNATKNITVGNNPHLGPYDGGYTYINQLNNIIPNFTAFTLTSTTITNTESKLFTNYNSGNFNKYTGDTFITILTNEGVEITNSLLAENIITNDPQPSPEETDCGCDILEDDMCLSLYVKNNDVTTTNATIENDFISAIYLYITNNNDFIPYNVIYEYYLFNVDGTKSVKTYQSPFVASEFCSYNDFYHEIYELNNTTGNRLINRGNICCISEGAGDGKVDVGKVGCGLALSCQWRLNGDLLQDQYLLTTTKTIGPPNKPITITVNEYYLKFKTPSGELRITNEADSGFCVRVGTYTEPTVITDPYTGKIGYACKLLKDGIDLMREENNVIYKIYEDRSSTKITCKSEETITNQDSTFQ
jgi:hypothetical protein